MLPYIRPDIDAGEAGGAGHDVGRVLAQQPVESAHQSAGGRKPDEQKAHHDHRGNEMRQIQNGLKRAAEAHGGDLVDHQRQNDGNREPYRQTIQAQPKGIADGRLALIGIEKALKIFEQRLRPRASQNAQRILVVLERDHHAVHGLVGEQDQQHQGRQKQQIQTPIPADSFPRSRTIHTVFPPARF